MDIKPEQRKQLLALIAEAAGPIVRDVVEDAFSKANKGLSESQNTIKSLLEGIAPTRQPTDKGILLGQMVRSVAAGGGDQGRAVAWASKAYGKDAPVIKALEASVASSGGFLIDDALSADVIEFLRPQVVVRALGATSIPMPSGNLRLPKLTGGATGSYVGETVDIQSTQQTTGQVVMNFKKLAALVPVSNDLLRFSSVQTDQVIRTDTIRAIAQAEDLAFIRSPGTQYSPKGLYWWAPAANVIPATAGQTLANVIANLGSLIVALLNANVRMINPGWIFAPRIWNFLATVQNTNGFYVFRDEMLTGKLWGMPFKVTTQIPINIAGGANNNTEVYLADFADAVIGESTTMTIDTSSEAAYFESGTLVSSFTRDVTLIRVIEEHDFAMRHDPSVAVLNTVTWT